MNNICITQDIIEANQIIFILLQALYERENNFNEKCIEQKMDSSTSSKAPSTDYAVKKNGSLSDIITQVQSSKIGEEKKNPRGKQPGAKGYGRKIPDDAEIEVCRHIPTKCLNCPNRVGCNAKETCGHVKNEIDFKIVTVNTVHQQIDRQCPMMNNETISGTMPERLKSSVQFGLSIISLVIYCYFLCLSYERIHSLLKSLLGNCAPSIGTMHSMVKKFADSVSVTSTYMGIFSYLKSLLGVLHADETGIRSNNKKLWLHVICNKDATYTYISQSRGINGMLEGGTALLQGSTIVHDCWKSYFLIEGITHALCNAHIIRELAGIIIFYNQEWAFIVLMILLEILDAKERALEEGIDHFTDEQIEEYKNRILEQVKKGIEMNPVPERKKGQKRVKKPRPYNLAFRIKEYINEILAFAIDFRIPFTNNIAERAARGAKMKLKNSLYLEMAGAIRFSKIYSVLDTAKKQNLSPYDTIRTLLCGWELHLSKAV